MELLSDQEVEDRPTPIDESAEANAIFPPDADASDEEMALPEQSVSTWEAEEACENFQVRSASASGYTGIHAAPWASTHGM